MSQVATQTEFPVEVTEGVPLTHITARKGWKNLDLRKLNKSRDLLWILALRDIKVRYKQAALGAAWALLQPLLTMVVLSVFFGKLVGIADKTTGVSYPVFLYAGLLPWTFFAAAVTASSNSLVSNSNLLRKVYFPRVVLVIASIGAPLADFFVASIVLLGMMVWYQVAPSILLLWAPVLLALTLIAALGVGMLLAALTAVYRDFRFVISFLIQIWFFVTPVIFPVTVVPERFRPLLYLNPMFGTIDGFRAAVLGRPLDHAALIVSAVASVAILAAACVYFGKTERRLADVV